MQSKHNLKRTLLVSLLVVVGVFFMASISLAEVWVTAEPIPSSRWGFSTSVVDGKVYVIGGGVGSKTAVLTVEEYDPATSAWTQKSAEIPTGRVGFSTSVVNGKIYAIGGHDPEAEVSTVEEYDPVTDSWTQKEDMPTARVWLSTSVVDGKIYAIGGQQPVTGGGGSSYLSTVEEYDPATDSWTTKEPMPTPRRTLATSTVNGRIYAIGGGSAGKYISTVEEYDPATNTWTTKRSMPTARGRILGCSSVVDGRIYVIGGLDNGKKVLSTVEVYDPATDTWMVSENPMPTPRALPCTSVVDGKIYAIGGSVSRDYDYDIIPTVEIYDPSQDTFVPPTAVEGTSWGRIKSLFK